MEKHQVAIVIPAFNEDSTIYNQVQSAKEYGIVIVVNDASTDQTEVKAQNAGAIIINHKINNNNSLRTYLGQGVRFPSIAEMFVSTDVLEGTSIFPNSSLKPESGWSFERFPVVHTPETDPHGYFLRHESGFKLLHCGDSGPCEGIESWADQADVILVEMGVPDFVESRNHHNPRQVQELAERHPEAKVLVTHNYADGEGRSGGFPMPDMAGNVVQLEDGDELSIEENGEFIFVKN